MVLCLKAWESRTLPGLQNVKFPVTSSLSLTLYFTLSTAKTMDELNLAKDYYSDIYKIDLSKPKKISKQYDIVLCLNTLEHVKNTSVAINNLGNMLKKNGLLYIKVPNRRAIFARLNLLLPSKLKKRILHLLFPLKSGDGFDAYYNYCEPTEMTHVLNQNQFVIKDIMLYKYSMYFTFFFPIYLSWRFLTIFQIIFNKNYCESFEIIAIKK